MLKRETDQDGRGEGGGDRRADDESELVLVVSK